MSPFRVRLDGENRKRFRQMLEARRDATKNYGMQPSEFLKELIEKAWEDYCRPAALTPKKPTGAERKAVEETLRANA